MNFTIPQELLDLREKTRAFIAEEIIPMENDPRLTRRTAPPKTCARSCSPRPVGRPAVPACRRELGGAGLSHVAKAIVFEEAGYSPLGPIALNIHAPDEGNMHLLEEVATPAQKERWLRPLVSGQIRSCFCMTEPAPGAGADPVDAADRRRARRRRLRDQRRQMVHHRRRRRRLRHHHGASMEDGEATMFLADMDQPGHHPSSA